MATQYVFKFKCKCNRNKWLKLAKKQGRCRVASVVVGCGVVGLLSMAGTCKKNREKGVFQSIVAFGARLLYGRSIYMDGSHVKMTHLIDCKTDFRDPFS